MKSKENVILHHGDCLSILPATILSKSIDLILCDLPYGVTKNDIDKRIDLVELWKQYERIIKDNGAILLFCQGMFFVELVNSNKKLFKYDLIWDKVLSSGFLNANRAPLRRHEQIAVFYKKQPVYNPQFTIGQPLHSKGNKRFHKETVNNNYGNFYQLPEINKEETTKKYPVSILKFQKVHPSKSLHPTEKSIALCEYLIKTYTNEGDIVLDNCMGSGTTGVAALNTGRKFIGIEKDKYFYDMSCIRMNVNDFEL